VRLFASLRDAAGWSERLIAVPTTACTPLSLWRLLDLDPRCADDTADPLPPGLRVAINQRFAAAETPLQPGDEVAFLPPITGG
jgi:molybdopterin synthase sulfur carrier subunit